MRLKSVPSYFLFPAFALAGVLAGCQTSPEQTTSVNSNVSGGTDLFLAVKTSDTCTALKAKLTGGTPADSAAFARQCIVEVLPDSARAATEPDSAMRCIWTKQRIDSGEALIPAFAADNKTTCDSLKVKDSASFAKYCRLPPPPPPAKCDSLKDTLAAMDSVSQAYLNLRHQVGGACALPLPPPPRRPAKDSLGAQDSLVAGDSLPPPPRPKGSGKPGLPPPPPKKIK